MDPVLFLIIVEFLMIGYRLMADIEQRCLEDKEDILNLLETYLFKSLELLSSYIQLNTSFY